MKKIQTRVWRVYGDSLAFRFLVNSTLWAALTMSLATFIYWADGCNNTTSGLDIVCGHLGGDPLFYLTIVALVLYMVFIYILLPIWLITFLVQFAKWLRKKLAG